MIEMDEFISPPMKSREESDRDILSLRCFSKLAWNILLRQMNTQPETKSAPCQKIIAFRDDFTACVKTDSVPILFRFFEVFAHIDGLEMHQTKTGVASVVEIPASFSDSSEITVLDVPVWPVNSKRNQKNQKSQIDNQQRIEKRTSVHELQSKIPEYRKFCHFGSDTLTPKLMPDESFSQKIKSRPQQSLLVNEKNM